MAYDASLGMEEKMGSLFQPDTLLSAQYFDIVRRKTNPVQSARDKAIIVALREKIS
ncbi:MAG: hypothetical protein HYY45_02790 [Deltaproteobacteria bacterium]|nr:hypothetical protein [Deltaproteobacteria bacterium]